MNYSTDSFSELLSEDKELLQIKKTLAEQGKVGIYGLNEGQRAMIEAQLVKGKDALLICESPKRAKALWEDMSQLVKSAESVYFPALELIPFEVLGQSGELERQRLNVLAKLLQKNEPLIVVTTIDALAKVLLTWPEPDSLGNDILEQGSRFLAELLVACDQKMAHMPGETPHLVLAGGCMGSARYADMVTSRLPARLRDGLTAEVCEPVQGGIRLAKRAAEKTAAR